jgi:hypothetical protein
MRPRVLRCGHRRERDRYFPGRCHRWPTRRGNRGPLGAGRGPGGRRRRSPGNTKSGRTVGPSSLRTIVTDPCRPGPSGLVLCGGGAQVRVHTPGSLGIHGRHRLVIRSAKIEPGCDSRGHRDSRHSGNHPGLPGRRPPRLSPGGYRDNSRCNPFQALLNAGSQSFHFTGELVSEPP